MMSERIYQWSVTIKSALGQSIANLLKPHFVLLLALLLVFCSFHRQCRPLFVLLLPTVKAFHALSDDIRSFGQKRSHTIQDFR